MSSIQVAKWPYHGTLHKKREFTQAELNKSKLFFCIAMQQERINRNRLFCSVQGVRKDHDTKAHYQSRSILFFFFFGKMGYNLRVFIWSSQKEHARFMKGFLQNLSSHAFLYTLNKGSSQGFSWQTLSPGAREPLDCQWQRYVVAVRMLFWSFASSRKRKKKRERERDESESCWMWLLQSTWISFRSQAHFLSLDGVYGWSIHDLSISSAVLPLASSLTPFLFLLLTASPPPSHTTRHPVRSTLERSPPIIAWIAVSSPPRDWSEAAIVARVDIRRSYDFSCANPFLYPALFKHQDSTATWGFSHKKIGR